MLDYDERDLDELDGRDRCSRCGSRYYGYAHDRCDCDDGPTDEQQAAIDAGTVCAVTYTDDGRHDWEPVLHGPSEVDRGVGTRSEQVV